MPDIKDTLESKGNKSTLASKPQLEAIASLAKNNNITSKALHDIMYEVTGKTTSRELTDEDASKLMARLKNFEKQNNIKIS